MAMALGVALECVVVVSKYSRLYCDVNRPLCSATLCREEGDGEVVELNKQLEWTE